MSAWMLPSLAKTKIRRLNIFYFGCRFGLFWVVEPKSCRSKGVVFHPVIIVDSDRDGSGLSSYFSMT